MTDSKVRMPTRGRPARISHDAILMAALEIGLPNLTMTAVAERLGVTIQALYRYVTDREELVNTVTETLVQRFPVPADHGQDWSDWAYTLAYEMRRMYDSAPGLADRAMELTQATPGVLGRYEASLRIALRSGFDERRALWATRAVLNSSSLGPPASSGARPRRSGPACPISQTCWPRPSHVQPSICPISQGLSATRSKMPATCASTTRSVV